MSSHAIKASPPSALEFEEEYIELSSIKMERDVQEKADVVTAKNNYYRTIIAGENAVAPNDMVERLCPRTSSKVNHNHWEIFLDFFEENPDIVRRRLSSTNDKDLYRKLWTDLTYRLNSLGLGEKPMEKWQKTWSDYKCSLKRKAIEISKFKKENGEGPPMEKKFTDLELRFLSILGNGFFKGCNVEELGASITTKEESNSLSPIVLQPSSDENTEESCGKRSIEEEEEEEVIAQPRIDHDYLAIPEMLPPRSKRLKTEDPTKMYRETIVVMKEIRDTLSNVSETLGTLTEAVTATVNNSAAIAKAIIALSETITRVAHKFPNNFNNVD